jgi:hypothetical protein
MKHLNFFKIILTATLIFAAGCSKSSKSKESGTFAPPELKEQNIARDGCLNVEALQSLFRPDSISYVALEVATDYKPDSDFTTAKTLFHTNAAFDLRDLATSRIFILNQPIQSDCTTVHARTVSGEKLTFKITRSTPSSISMSLQKPDDSASISTYRKEGLEKKFQPIRYEIEALEDTHLRVITTFKSFDAHCRSKNIIIASIQNDYFWAYGGSEIPTQINVAEEFYKSLLSSFKADAVINPLPPLPGSDGIPADLPSGYVSVSVEDLRNLKLKEVREDLKKCTY